MRSWLWVSAHRRVLVELAIVFVVAFVPRQVGIGTFLTADEKNWVGRGVEFVRAVREFRFNDTLQTTHPGIPTLWISGLSSAIVSLARGQAFTFDAIRAYTTASQIPLAVINSLLVVGMFGAASRLVPTPVALLAALTIALDPFLIGHSKLVHVDALVAGLTTLSLLLFLRATRSPWALLGSAVTGALAILSKLPGAILVPMALLTLFVRSGSFANAQRRVANFRLFGQWLTIMAAVILVLWPGLLWVPDPVGNIKIVKRDLQVALATPHYMAEDYTLNPWHYPATLLTRTTVPTLAGILVFLFFLVSATKRLVRRSKASPASPDQASFGIDLRVAWLLVAYIVLFIGGMMLGAKKGDRYILPIFPVLDLLAAVGIVTIVARLRPQWSFPRVVTFAGLFLVAPLAVEVVRLGPYQLAHYNPLVPPNFSQELGWGEGLDQVAKFLNAQPSSDTASAASWYPEELRALVRRPVYHLNSREQLPIGYVVLYRNMLGRAPSHPANDFLDEYYQKQQPVFTAEVNGLPYAWVYRKPAFQSVIGELTPEKTLVAELPVGRDAPLKGIELLLATYSRRANQGTLVARVRESVSGPDLREARSLVRAEDDNRWVIVRFERPLEIKTDSIVILITAEGTEAGNAPTIRFAPNEEDAPPYAVTTERPISENALARTSQRGLLGMRVLQASP